VTEDRPYRVYRARPRFLPRRERGEDRPGPALPRPRRGGVPWGRVVKWLALAVTAWLAVSVLAFLASSLLAEGVSDEAEAQLGGPAGLLEPTTILLLGSDARSSETAEPGSQGIPSRADSIMLMRVGGGASARISIPRDTLAEIPGRGRDKINAAYAQGGVALAVQSLEGLLGLEIDHAMLVDFERFPGLIDAMGGITYRGSCVVSKVNGGYANGGVTIRIRGGEPEHLNGEQALALARTRKNACNSGEDDRARARRQQKIVGAMRSKVLSPAGFLRLPLIAWATPRALRTDMGGPSLMGLAVGAAISGDAQTRVLPVGPAPGTGLVVDQARAERAVARFLEG
jgi:LCP family protein required for cell wall assembly